jgi:hypothetical protein
VTGICTPLVMFHPTWGKNGIQYLVIRWATVGFVKFGTVKVVNVSLQGVKNTLLSFTFFVKFGHNKIQDTSTSLYWISFDQNQRSESHISPEGVPTLISIRTSHTYFSIWTKFCITKLHIMLLRTCESTLNINGRKAVLFLPAYKKLHLRL